MKEDELYIDYLNYLDWRLNESQISKGKYSLLKISESSFNQFKNSFENDEHFRNKIVKIKISEIRDKKIDDIFDDFN
jgi:hypothetical protein